MLAAKYLDGSLVKVRPGGSQFRCAEGVVHAGATKCGTQMASASTHNDAQIRVALPEHAAEHQRVPMMFQQPRITARKPFIWLRTMTTRAW